MSNENRRKMCQFLCWVGTASGGSAANIEEFWKHMPERPGMKRGSFKKWCIPIAIHGDGVAVSNIRGKASKQVDCISWPFLENNVHPLKLAEKWIFARTFDPFLHPKTHFWTHFSPLTKTHLKPTLSGNKLFPQKSALRQP